MIRGIPILRVDNHAWLFSGNSVNDVLRIYASLEWHASAKDIWTEAMTTNKNGKKNNECANCIRSNLKTTDALLISQFTSYSRRNFRVSLRQPTLIITKISAKAPHLMQIISPLVCGRVKSYFQFCQEEALLVSGGGSVKL